MKIFYFSQNPNEERCHTSEKEYVALAEALTIERQRDTAHAEAKEARDKLESRTLGMLARINDLNAQLSESRSTLRATRNADHGAAIEAVLSEVSRATAKFPTWPTDPNHAFAVVGEEYGETLKEVLQLTYEPHKSSKESVKKEATQLAAMAVRFLMSLDRYEYTAQPQHSQQKGVEQREALAAPQPATAKEATVRSGDWYCCTAEFGQHDPTCPNYKEKP